MKNKFWVSILTCCVILSLAGCGKGEKVKAESKNDEETVLESDVETAAESDIEIETIVENNIETVILSENNQEEDIQDFDSYDELITAAKECIVNKDAPIPEEYGFTSVLKTAGDYEILGYLIEDIDGNGIDELIFGGNGTRPDGSWDGIIYDIYTISDGELVHVLNGWERNRYYFCENGMIANEGSSSVAKSNHAYFTFWGSELHLIEAVIYDGERDQINPWFYSTESEYDTEYAEPISEELAKEIREKYVYEHPTFIPFT